MSQAQVNQVYDLIQKAYPVTPVQFGAKPGPQNVENWLAKGHTPEKIGADLTGYLATIPFPAAEADGGNTYRRRRMFGQEFDAIVLLDGYYLGGKPKPTNAEMHAQLFPGESPKPKPTDPTKPPVVTPPDTGALDALKEWAINRFTANEGRIATLEARVRGIREKLGIPEEGDGAPGGR